tara:strand:+ start:69 stop:326 length:258 start_codon:yes stop_codon:yes gene_type:complete
MSYKAKPNTVYVKKKTSSGVFLKRKTFVNNEIRGTYKYQPIEPLFTEEEKRIYVDYFINEYKHRTYLKAEYDKQTIDFDNYFKRH